MLPVYIGLASPIFAVSQKSVRNLCKIVLLFSLFLMATGEDAALGPSGLGSAVPASSSSAGSFGRVDPPTTVSSHVSTHRLAPEDVQVIAGAVADILRSSTSPNPLTAPPTSSVTSLTSHPPAEGTSEGKFTQYK